MRHTPLLFLFSLFLVGIQPLRAQVIDDPKATMNWGPIVFMSDNASVVYVDSQYVYTHNLHQRNPWSMNRWIFTKHLKSDMSVIWQTETSPIRKEGVDLAFEEVKVVGDEFFAFYSAFDSDADEVTLLGHKITSKNRVGELHPLASYPTDEVSEGGFRIRWNDSQDRFAIIAQPQFLNTENARFETWMYDKAFNEQFHFEVNSRLHHDNFLIVDAQLSDNHQLYVLTIDYLGERANRSGQRFNLIKCSQELSRPESLDLELSRYFVLAPWLHVDKNQVRVGGLASVRSFGTLSESFVLTIDSSTYTIGNAWFNDLNPKNRRVLNELELDDSFFKNSSFLKVIDIINRNDGGYTLILQIQYDLVENRLRPTTGSRSDWSRSTVHYREDILIQALDTVGIEMWMTLIPLMHEFENHTLYTGCLVLTQNERVHLLFNDLPSNLNEYKSSIPDILSLTNYNLEEGAIVHAAIDESGNLKAERLGSTEHPQSGLYFIPGFSSQSRHHELSSHAFMLYNNRIQAGRISIK